MSRSAKNPFPFADSVARQIKEARTRTGISENKLSQKSGISRRHLAELTKGANVTLLVARKAMTALELEELDLGEGTRLVMASTRNANAVVHALGELERGAELVRQSVVTLRTILNEDLANDASGVHETLATKAASLIENFAQYVRTLDSEEKVDAVRATIEGSAGSPLDVVSGRRRSSP